MLQLDAIPLRSWDLQPVGGGMVGDWGDTVEVKPLKCNYAVGPEIILNF